jgi:hypothetical protein
LDWGGSEIMALFEEFLNFESEEGIIYGPKRRPYTRDLERFWQKLKSSRLLAEF